MSQIINITSEALQATIRRLLPSQQGFGEDLQASNVITPIIDLTPSAEGSAVPSYLQRALSFDSQTEFRISNTTQDLAASAGFWQLTFNSTISSDATASSFCGIYIDESGISTKYVFRQEIAANSAELPISNSRELVVYLEPNQKLVAQSTNAKGFMNGTYRQIADTAGNLINPAGFTPQ